MKYPIMLDITGKRVAIIGGGNVALRKIKGLIDTGADILVVAPHILPEIKAFDVRIKEEAYRTEHLEGAFMLFICTNNPEVNQMVLRDSKPDQLVNDTTEQANSHFFNMATVMKNDLLVGISTGGGNPGYAKKVKREIGQLVENIATEEIKNRNK
ncbi:bifunctional precorrin-2 dehydrogenase/sirohydrochlorin ferrochelatase [Listeria welshimeri]|nr:bifunctional precorrin-2 dehydrogenase/sirohydrochlorin ferrochelatase [Listeria welshimeri]MBC1673672.1 bifunctional precorrin-2 dehydrogenase/sirohydrochlorin ferrochelatase [Listeria welshimeri]